MRDVRNAFERKRRIQKETELNEILKDVKMLKPNKLWHH